MSSTNTHWYTCPIAFPVRRNPQNRSLLVVVSFPTWSGIICHFWTPLRISRPSCELPYATNTSNCKQETFLWESSLHWVLLPTKKRKTERPSSVLHSSSTVSFWLLKPATSYAHACLLPRLSWSWTVLLPSDTHRKYITSITAVLLPFVTYLLILPCTVLMCVSK
jgi:hypothetical protein